MIRLIAIAGLLIATSTIAQTDSPWLNWVVKNAPYGFDITPDGTIWINLSEVGRTDDYAVRAEDLRDAREARDRKPSFWIRGYHKRNTKVRYRESKTRYILDCDREMMSTSTSAYYNGDGEVLWQTGYSPEQFIIPGTYGAEYYRLFCEL